MTISRKHLALLPLFVAASGCAYSEDSTLDTESSATEAEALDSTNVSYVGVTRLYWEATDQWSPRSLSRSVSSSGRVLVTLGGWWDAARWSNPSRLPTDSMGGAFTAVINPSISGDPLRVQMAYLANAAVGTHAITPPNIGGGGDGHLALFELTGVDATNPVRASGRTRKYHDFVGVGDPNNIESIKVDTTGNVPQAGDIALLVIATDNDDASSYPFTTPSGWTKVDSHAPHDNVGYFAAWRVVTTSGHFSVTTNWDDTTNSTNVAEAAVVVFAPGSGTPPPPPPPPPATQLTNDVELTGLNGAAASSQYYRIDVPAGVAQLTYKLSGGTGNPNLYVKNGATPSLTAFDCKSTKTGTSETCTINAPTAGTYYALVYGAAAYSNVKIRATYPLPPPLLVNGVPVTLSGAEGSKTYYRYEVPAGAARVVIRTSGTGAGENDADLYVRYGSLPTLNEGESDCSPWLEGPNESCAFNNPTPGTYFVMVDGYSSYSSVALSGSHQ